MLQVITFRTVTEVETRTLFKNYLPSGRCWKGMM